MGSNVSAVRTSRGTAALAVAALTLAAGCGRGDKTSSPETTAPTDTTVPATTTTTSNEDELRKLLLVATDVPEFKEKAATADPPEEEDDPFVKCEAELPALKALDDAIEVEGDTFVRGPEDGVEVSSDVTGTTPEKAEAAVNELLEPKTATCFQTAITDAVKKELPAGVEVTPKLTITRSSVAGADQAVLASFTGTVRARGQAVGFRSDFVVLRRDGEIVTVYYAGPTNLTSAGERQRIVAAVSKKLGGDTTATTSGSTTSSTAASRSSTTRRSTTTTRRSTTSSSQASTTSTTR